MTDLLPCPFCGSSEAISPREDIVSLNSFTTGEYCAIGCDICGAQTGQFATRELASAAWNRRTAHSSGVKVKDEELTGRLKELATEVFPSANKYAVSDGVKRIISILERVTPNEYAALHASMFPPRTDRFDDGQPDEIQEWHDYDPDC